MTEVGRNRYGVELGIELTHPLSSDAARAAGELLAKDVQEWLKANDWGYGRARIESVYVPESQFEHGDFVPEVEDVPA